METWTWEREDGSVEATFLDLGYGNADSPRTLRLMIEKVGIVRPK